MLSLLNRSSKISEPTSSTIAQMNACLEKFHMSLLFPYETFDKATGLYHGRNGIGFTLACEPITGANKETIDILNSIITDSLPEKAVMQCLTWASPNIETALNAWEAERAGASDTFKMMAQKRVQHFSSKNYQSLTKQNTYLLRNFKTVISCTIANSAQGLELEAFIQFRDGLINSLATIGMPATNMAPSAFITLLNEIVNLPKQHQSYQWDEYKPIAMQVPSFETRLKVNKENMTLNDDEFDIRTFSVREYPSHWAQWGMNDLLGDAFNDKLSIPCPFLLAFTIYKPSSEEMGRRASFKNARATQQAASPLARFMPLVSKIEADWKYAVHQLEEGQKLVKGFFQVISFAPKGEGQDAESKLMSLFTSKGWKLEKDMNICLQSWQCALPMMIGNGMVSDLEKFGRFKTMLSNNAANLMPIQGEWKGHQSPRMLLSGRRGQPFYWDPFANNEGNYNVAVVGKSGSGKSVFMQETMSSILSTGGKVIVIDIGRSFEKACRSHNGLFIEFKKDHHICINPFTNIIDFNEDLKLLRPMFASMAAPSRKTDDYENALIEQALQATWQKYENTATVTHVANWLTTHQDKRAKDLGVMLHPYTKDGSYAKYFEGQSTLDFSNDLVVLELEELKNMKDLQSIVQLIVMYQVTQTMYLGDRKKPIACIMDECWDLFKGSDTAAFIEEGYRRARKYNGCFITGTQSANDYTKSAATRAAFENSDWRLFMSQKDESIQQLKDSGQMQLDAYKERQLRSIKTIQGEYAEVLIDGPGGYVIGRLFLDDFSRVLYSTKGEEFTAVKAIMDAGLPINDAITQYLDKVRT